MCEAYQVLLEGRWNVAWPGRQETLPLACAVFRSSGLMFIFGIQFKHFPDEQGFWGI